jgi:hypothetical protein
MKCRSRRAAGVGAALVVMAVAGTVFAGVEVDYDKEADFSRIQTYVWGEGTPAKNELNQKRIVAAVEKELSLKGLKAADGTPHMIVVTHVSTDQQVVMDATTMGGYGYGRPYWGTGWGTTSVNVRTIPVGTLVVDMLDGTTKNLIWRGVASDTVSPDPKQIEKKINQVVAKMFKKFPPAAKK